MPPPTLLHVCHAIRDVCAKELGRRDDGRRLAHGTTLISRIVQPKMGRLFIGLITAAMLTGCVSESPNEPRARTESPLVDFPVLLNASPLPLPMTSQQNVTPEATDGGLLLVPASADVQWGRPYRFSLFTHCGLEGSPVDFDGSFWGAEERKISRFYSTYYERKKIHQDRVFGSMIILPPGDLALFRARNDSELLFKRYSETPAVFPACF